MSRSPFRHLAAAASLSLTALLAGCMGAAVSDTPTKAQTAFARDIADRTAGEPQDCISTFGSGQSLNIVDDRTLTYRDGRILWVNRLESACPGMRPNDILIVRRFGGRLCRLDTVEPRDWGLNDIAGPRCALGAFTPYTSPE